MLYCFYRFALLSFNVLMMITFAERKESEGKGNHWYSGRRWNMITIYSWNTDRSICFNRCRCFCTKDFDILRVMEADIVLEMTETLCWTSVVSCFALMRQQGDKTVGGWRIDISHEDSREWICQCSALKRRWRWKDKFTFLMSKFAFNARIEVLRYDELKQILNPFSEKGEQSAEKMLRQLETSQLISSSRSIIASHQCLSCLLPTWISDSFVCSQA